MALTLAVGFVVDDAIVMLENIVRHMEMGKPKMQAAIDGAAEVGFTILSMTFSLAAVFIPFLFMGGIIGKLFHEFAVTIGVAILVSGFVSLTLTPMLSSRFLRSDHGKTARPLLQDDGAVLRRVARPVRADARLGHGAPAARRSCSRSSSSSPPAYLFWSTPKGLFPTDDTGQLLATTEAAAGRVVRRAESRSSSEVADVVREGSRRSVGDVVGRHDGGGEPGPADDRPQADRRAQAQRRADRARPAMASTAGVSGHHDVHPESAGDLDRRPRVEEPLSVHAAERRHRGAQYRRAHDRNAAARRCPGSST